MCYAEDMDDDLDSPAARLKWARLKAGYQDAEAFARKAGLNPVTYRSYENGANGFAKHSAKFAKVLGVTADWLLAGGPVPDGAEDYLRETRDIAIVATGIGIVMVREVDITYAMGDGSVVADYPDLGLMPFHDQFLRALRVRDPQKVFVCRGDGDSMSPTIHSQDMVLIDTSRNRITMSDHIWALVIAGAGMIKRIRPLPDGRILVLSDNPAVPEQAYNAEDVYVVGKVIWIGRMM